MKKAQLVIYEWFSKMVGASANLSQPQIEDLEKWEYEHTRTSTWPGWEPLIGKCPTPDGIPFGNDTVKSVKVSIPAKLRWQVWERDNFTCVFCGCRRFLSIDHKLAECKGGTLDLDNLQTLCVPCNSKKGAR